MHPIKTILFPTDESECSRSAFRVASELAKDLGARLIILEVVPSAVTIYGPPSEAYFEQMRSGLDQLQVDDAHVCVERRIVEGNPAAAILREAEDSNTDLILMASHGRTGAKRILLGSVAETVLRRSRCPVLVIKTPGCPQEASETTDSINAGLPVKALWA